MSEARSVYLTREERDGLERLWQQARLGFRPGLNLEGRQLVRALIERFDEAGETVFEIELMDE